MTKPSQPTLCLKLTTIGFLIAALGLGAPLWQAPAPASAQTPNPKPITKSGLTHALQIGGLSERELVEQVTHRGVDFTVTPETESDLRHAGADDVLIEAVRQNYRSGGSSNASGAASDHKSASAMAALDAPDAAPHPSSSSTDVSSPRHPVTIRDVHKLYIEKMQNGLDGYLRAAFSSKLGSFFTIVLDRSEAEAILESTDTRAPGSVSIIDLSGKVVLWSGSATDKEKVYLNFNMAASVKWLKNLPAS
jgi:hypothetical protein